MPVDLTAQPAHNQPRPPPARRNRNTPARPPPIPPSRQEAREEALNGIGKITALILTLRGSYADAGAIAQHGPGIAHETAALAETDDKVASLIDYLTEAGPYMGLAVAALPLVMQILANHGRIDASRLPPESGVIPPDVLESRVRADMEARRLRFLKAAQESQREAEQAAREFAASSPNGRTDG